VLNVLENTLTVQIVVNIHAHYCNRNILSYSLSDFDQQHPSSWWMDPWMEAPHGKYWHESTSSLYQVWTSSLRTIRCLRENCSLRSLLRYLLTTAFAESQAGLILPWVIGMMSPGHLFMYIYLLFMYIYPYPFSIPSDLSFLKLQSWCRIPIAASLELTLSSRRCDSIISWSFPKGSCDD